MRALFVFSVLGLALMAVDSHAGQWNITKSQWSESDEKNYRDFVASIGKSKCNSFDSCLKGSGNPYRASDPAGAHFFSDCADLPYMLRAYFASKNGLPFSIVSEVRSADGAGGDIRYSPNGNLVSKRTDIIARPGPQFPDAGATLRGISDAVSSAMFRFNPKLAVTPIERDGQKLVRMAPDFYSVRVDRNSIQPGTIIYDPNGHVAVVYSVESDGRILFIDAHPDNSLTHGTYGKKFARARPGMGAGFKKFRPLVLVGATKTGEGETLIGGEVYFLPDSSIPDFDVTQFFGTNPGNSWGSGSFQIEGQAMDYYEWVRVRLASANLKFHPVEEMRNMMSALCGDLNDRVAAVNTGIASGISKRSHPANLPNNIYGTEGDWESFSSPSRDARLKTSFVEVYDQTKSLIERAKNRDPRIEYNGSDLVGDLLAAYNEESARCTISYKKSDSTQVTLNYDQISTRLFNLSFDPYDCVELRWGATGSELESCHQEQEKFSWYEAEARLRNQIERSYETKMGFSLRQLQAHPNGSGVDNPPEMGLKTFLETAR